MSDIAKNLLFAVRAAENKAGTLPAAKSVKIVPSDWHTLTAAARSAAVEVSRLQICAEELLEALEEMRDSVFGKEAGDEPDVYSDYDRLQALHALVNNTISKATA